VPLELQQLGEFMHLKDDFFTVAHLVNKQDLQDLHSQAID
jgi:hypothetical protein